MLFYVNRNIQFSSFLAISRLPLYLGLIYWYIIFVPAYINLYLHDTLMKPTYTTILPLRLLVFLGLTDYRYVTQ